MRLRRVSVEAPGISRRRRGSGFSYEGPSGGSVDRETVRRIRALVIPPAWTDVWICRDPDGHIQATGVDAAGRRQYRYHDRWRARRDAEKFDRMIAFARALPALRRRAEADLRRPGLPRPKALACAARLLDRAFFRVGSESYARRNGTFGLATIRKDHVRERRGRLVFAFAGKNGTRHVQEVDDPGLVPVVRTMKRRRSGGAELLAFREKGQWRDVRSADVNDYLAEAAAGPFTAKDFRTWHATVLASVSVALKAGQETATSPSRLASEAVKEVATFLGNTPAVARASYIDPRVFDRLEEGETIAPTLERLGIDDPADAVLREAVEAAVLELLEESPSAARAA